MSSKKSKTNDTLQKLQDQLVLAKSKGDSKTARLIQKVIDRVLTNSHNN